MAARVSSMISRPCIRRAFAVAGSLVARWARSRAWARRVLTRGLGADRTDTYKTSASTRTTTPKPGAVTEATSNPATDTTHDRLLNGLG